MRAVAGDPFQRSTDPTIGAGQNDGEDELSPVLPWTITSGGHYTIRAVTNPLLHLHLHRQQLPSDPVVALAVRPPAVSSAPDL
ncbi:hypothetical protein ACLOJK_004400 [Asimina triloba]